MLASSLLNQGFKDERSMKNEKLDPGKFSRYHKKEINEWKRI
jgi:hypothetical protein